jgi:alpha-beta hydrolase superfamily lysophospholipase
MNPANRKSKWRSIVKWVLWILIVQFVLINISGIFYGYRLTHFYEPASVPLHNSKNIFSKTWRLFTGPKFQKLPVRETPIYPYEAIQLFTKNNNAIEAWYIPVDSSKGTVILFHGLGANKVTMLEEAYEFRYLGFNVMLVDLRAHGNSSGNTTTIGVRESEEVKLAYDQVLKKGEKNIILCGLSLGAVVIAKSIYDYGITPSKIILDAPFASLRDHLRGRARILGFPSEPFAGLVTFWAGLERGFNGFRHATTRYAEKINCPVLLQCGALDHWVLQKESNSIFEHIASADKKMVIYPGAGHESFLNNDPWKWRKEIEEFLKN